MSIELFLPKFAEFFGKYEFQFLRPEFDPADIKRANLFSKLLIGGFNSYEFGIIGALFPVEGANTTNENLRSTLIEMQKYGELVGVYLKYGAPRIQLVVYAEELNDEEILGRFVLIHESASKMHEFGLRILGRGKLSVRCSVFTVFSSHARAIHFKENLESKCKNFKFFGDSTHILPWTVDLERKRVMKYNGLPATQFKEAALEKAFFD
jgi:hypothetical protein